MQIVSVVFFDILMSDCSRSELILKLAQLRDYWQGAVQRADQRRSLVDGLVRRWHLYTRSLSKLQRFLSDMQNLVPMTSSARCSLPQLRRSLLDLQVGQMGRWNLGKYG